MEPQRYRFEFDVAAERGEVFRFLADPANLNRVTPSWFDLRILTPTPLVIDAGAEIDYRLRWRGLPLRWSSRITSWEPHRAFTYVQTRGPYRSFWHEHVFEVTNSGTRVIDRVEWRAWGGSLANRWIRRDLDTIFRHRAGAVVVALPGGCGSTE